MGYAHAADMPVKATVAPVPFFLVNDNAISFTYFPDATNPGVTARTARYEVDLSHFDVWEYGTNLAVINFQQYGPENPALGLPGAYGAREGDMILQSTLGFNEMSHSKMFSNWLTKDVSLEGHFFGGINDDLLAAQPTQPGIGLQFTLNLPGTVNVAILAQKEFTRNTFEVLRPHRGLRRGKLYFWPLREANGYVERQPRVRVDAQAYSQYCRTADVPALAGYLCQRN